MAPEQKYFDFKTILLLKFYLTGHAESYCHLQHQEHNGRSSVTDKGQGDTCIGHQIQYNGNVKDHLQRNMYKNPVTISEPNRSGAFCSNKKQSVQKIPIRSVQKSLRKFQAPHR